MRAQEPLNILPWHHAHRHRCNRWLVKLQLMVLGLLLVSALLLQVDLSWQTRHWLTVVESQQQQWQALQGPLHQLANLQRLNRQQRQQRQRLDQVKQWQQWLACRFQQSFVSIDADSVWYSLSLTPEQLTIRGQTLNQDHLHSELQHLPNGFSLIRQSFQPSVNMGEAVQFDLVFQLT